MNAQCTICDASHPAGTAFTNHLRRHNALWCVCVESSPVKAYGWAYCDRCQRGFEPSTPPISQHTLNRTRQRDETPTPREPTTPNPGVPEKPYKRQR